MDKTFSWSDNSGFDFSAAETKLGFEINGNLKEFYSKNLFEEKELALDKKYLTTSLNNGDWFAEQDRITIQLFGDKPLENFENVIVNNFNQEDIYGASYDQSLEKRYLLGFLFDNRGQMQLLFNNTTGNVEWCDFEYGAEKWEDNPRGIIANEIREFTEKL